MRNFKLCRPIQYMLIQIASELTVVTRHTETPTWVVAYCNNNPA